MEKKSRITLRITVIGTIQINKYSFLQNTNNIVALN